MAHYVYSLESSKELLSLSYKEIELDAMRTIIHDWFIQRGYKLKTGEPGNGGYVKGNRVARILLGAFYKYFLFEVSVFEAQNEIRVEVKRATTGMSGGLIGMNQVKKELEAIDLSLQVL